MTKCRIKLGSIEEVKEFTTLANSYDFELDLISGRYTVDARSIMGIFSLDLTKALTLVIHASDEESQEFLEDAKKFIDN